MLFRRNQRHVTVGYVTKNSHICDGKISREYCRGKKDDKRRNSYDTRNTSRSYFPTYSS